MNFEVIYDKIHVYKGLFSDSRGVASKIMTLSDASFEGIVYRNWRDWYTFGRICDASGYEIADETRYVNKASEYPIHDYPMLELELQVWNSLSSAITKSFNHYIESYNITVPDPHFYTYPNLAWYNPDVDTDGMGHTMNLHTDYHIGGWWWPGEKFFLTSTTYVNDDYEGGEIVFYINGDLLSYKPQAGDVLVFPSGDPRFPGKHPYFHAVNKVTNGKKILVRSYVKYFSSENIHLWMSGQQIYGRDKWKSMTESQARGKNMLPWPGLDKRDFAYSDDLVRHLFG